MDQKITAAEAKLTELEEMLGDRPQTAQPSEPPRSVQPQRSEPAKPYTPRVRAPAEDGSTAIYAQKLKMFNDALAIETNVARRTSLEAQIAQIYKDAPSLAVHSGDPSQDAPQQKKLPSFSEELQTLPVRAKLSLETLPVKLVFDQIGIFEEDLARQSDIARIRQVDAQVAEKVKMFEDGMKSAVKILTDKLPDVTSMGGRAMAYQIYLGVEPSAKTAEEIVSDASDIFAPVIKAMKANQEMVTAHKTDSERSDGFADRIRPNNGQERNQQRLDKLARQLQSFISEAYAISPNQAKEIMNMILQTEGIAAGQGQSKT